MIKFNELYGSYIENHFEESKESAEAVKDYLEHSSVAYHGRCVHTLHIPKIYSKKETDYFDSVVKTTYGIFEKIILEYLNNAEYRKLFPFSKRLEELILIPNLYDGVLPIARFDIFFNEEDYSFKFCEINTDGTSAMNEDYELNRAIRLNNVHAHMKDKYSFHAYELFDTWVREFMNIYATYEKRVEHPYVAIVDFMAGGSVTEFAEFKKRFEFFGYDTEICEITELTFENGTLYSPTGHKIDAVYRRAVTSDLEKHWDEIPAFLEAIRSQAVCVIGSLCTQIIHNKWLFKLIAEPETMELLTKEEQEFVKLHVPYTRLLTSSDFDLEELLETKDKWIVKPLDSYASQGVFAGTDYSTSAWADILMQHMDQEYIIQEYYTPYRTKNIYFNQKEPQFVQYSNMAGLFVYNGKFKGIYSRLSDGGIISSQYNEKAAATLVVDEKEVE